MGVETDTGKFKVGDGATYWVSLGYSSGVKGDTGAAGAAGTAGADGAAGSPGAKGDQGDPGAAGPNTVSTTTDTNITGILKGDGAHVGAASAGTDYVGTSDSRLTNSRTPTTHASTHASTGGDAIAAAIAAGASGLMTGSDKTKLDGIASGATVGADWSTNVANKPTLGDAAALDVGTTAGTVAAGDDSRMTNARTPTSHASTHNAGGGDALAIDAAAGTGSLRTIGTGATNAAAGNHTHSTYQPTGMTVLANDTLAQALATNINTKLTVTANRTLTTTVPAAGTRCSVMILTNSTSTWTITFGTGFKPTGTLATGTTTARIFVVNFISDGTNLYEAGRTAAMAA
jgi:hypothetical protein